LLLRPGVGGEERLCPRSPILPTLKRRGESKPAGRSLVFVSQGKEKRRANAVSLSLWTGGKERLKFIRLPLLIAYQGGRNGRNHGPLVFLAVGGERPTWFVITFLMQEGNEPRGLKTALLLRRPCPLGKSSPGLTLPRPGGGGKKAELPLSGREKGGTETELRPHPARAERTRKKR